MTDINSYELSRKWFDFCFDNPDKICPNHTALYFFIIEHCNRLGWKEKFGLPMEMAKEAIGIKNYKTYSKTFQDLINFGFITIHQKSKNQYSANVIGLVKNTKATTKALSKATQKHSQKQRRGIVGIYKPINLEPNNLEPMYSETDKTVSTHTPEFEKKYSEFTQWIEKYANLVSKMRKPITIDEYKKISDAIAKGKIKKTDLTDVLLAMGNKPDLCKKYVSAYLTLLSWIRMRGSKPEKISQNYGSIPNNGKPYGPASPRREDKSVPGLSTQQRADLLQKMLDSFYREENYIDFGAALYSKVEASGLNDHRLDDQAWSYSSEIWFNILKNNPENAEFEEVEKQRLFRFWHLRRVREKYSKEDLFLTLIKLHDEVDKKY